MDFKGAFYLFAVAAIFILPESLFAQKNNDFTKSNSFFGRKYESSESSLNDRKSGFQGREYFNQNKEFLSDGENNLSEKRAWLNDNKDLGYMQSDRWGGNKKDYGDRIPEFHQDVEGWYKAGNKLNLSNADRNLTKEYKGRLDSTKKFMEGYQDYLQENYAEMIDRSMQDINRYNFRSTHSLDPGIATQVAGSQIHEEEEQGILESLLYPGRKRIERNPVSLKGPERAQGTFKPSGAVMNREDLGVLDLGALGAGQAARPNAADRNANASPQSGETPNVNSSAQPKQPGGTRVDRGRYDFLSVPQGLQMGEPTIRVKIKDEPEF